MCAASMVVGSICQKTRPSTPASLYIESLNAPPRLPRPPYATHSMPRRHGQVIAGVVSDRQTIEQLIVGAYAQNVAKAALKRGNPRQGARQHVHDLNACGIAQLPGPVEVQTDLRLRELLLFGVVRLGDRRGFIADAIKARRTAAIIDQTCIDGPQLLAQASPLILGIEYAFDALRGAPYR